MARKLKRAVVKEEFVKLTGDDLEAVVLNQFLYWLERVKDFDKFLVEEINSEEEREDKQKHGWIWKTAEEMKEEIMTSYSAKTVGRRIKDLVDNGWIERRRNPKKAFDKTYQYRPNIEKINKDLQTIGYQLQGYKFDNIIGDKTKRQNDHPHRQPVQSKDRMSLVNGHDVSAIPEITTEITTETYNNMSEKEKIDFIYNQLNSKWLQLFKNYIDIYRQKNKTKKITDSRHLKLLEELFEIFKTNEFEFDGQEYQLTENIFETGINKIIEKDVDNLNYAKQVWIGEIEKKQKNNFNDVPNEFEAYEALSN